MEESDVLLAKRKRNAGYSEWKLILYVFMDADIRWKVPIDRTHVLRDTEAMNTQAMISKHEYVEVVVRTSYGGNKPLQFYHMGQSFRVREIVDSWDTTKPWIAGRGPMRQRVFWCKVPVLGMVVLHHDVGDDVWRLEKVVE